MVAGDVRLSDGGIPKRAAIYLESSTAAVPSKDRASLSLRSAHSQPELLILPIGTTLLIGNDDHLAHSVFSVSQVKPLALGPLLVGESRSVQLDRPGIVDLFCAMHDAMQATVVVASSHLTTLSNSQGAFALPGVPVGRYRAIAYAPELGQAVLSVDIRNGERITLHFQIAHPSHPPVAVTSAVAGGAAKGKR